MRYLRAVLEVERSRRLERARRGLATGRVRYERSWAKDFADRLSSLDAFNWATLFGACLLWSVVPMMILLSSLANDTIDNNLSRHIGLDSRGAHIMSGLFRHKPTHAVVPVVTGLLFAFAGSVALAGSLQVIYERLFGQEHRGNMPRLVLWVAALVGALVIGNVVGAQVRSAAGPIARGVWSFVIVGAFFAWTMHYLLGGRAPWRLVIRPALATALGWVGFSVFSAIYFSSALIDDHRIYGTIGVVFTLLTWFIAVATVVVLGAVAGAVWQDRWARSETGS